MRDLAQQAITDLEDLVSGLRSPADVDQSVHATRTGIKRLRAFVRLARASVGDETYRHENRSLRDAARLIAPARDARVLIETAESESAPPTVLATLHRAHADAIDELEAGVRLEAVRCLESIANRWKHLAWNGPPSSSIRSGLGATYRRARSDYSTVLVEPTDATFHGWRRRVKYVRYQLEAIAVPEEIVTPYTVLGDDLGLEHDHTVLIGVCSDAPGDAAFATLARRSTARRLELRTRALDAGSHVFVVDPDRFVDSVGTSVALG